MIRSPDTIENNRTTPHKPISVRRKLAAGALAVFSGLGLIHHVDNNINGPLNTGAAADLVGSAIVNDTSTIAEYVNKKGEDFAATVGDEISHIITGPRADFYLNQQKELGRQLNIDVNHVDGILKGEVLVHKGVTISTLPMQSYLNTDTGAQFDVPSIDWKDIEKINGADWSSSSSLFIVKNPELVRNTDGNTGRWMRIDLSIKGTHDKIVPAFISLDPEKTSSFVSSRGEYIRSENIGTLNPSEKIGETLVPWKTVSP